MKLGLIKDKIKNWDDEMSLCQFIIRVRRLQSIKRQQGIKCWDCGHENLKIRKICTNCNCDL